MRQVPGLMPAAPAAFFVHCQWSTLSIGASILVGALKTIHHDHSGSFLKLFPCCLTGSVLSQFPTFGAIDTEYPVAFFSDHSVNAEVTASGKAYMQLLIG